MPIKSIKICLEDKKLGILNLETNLLLPEVRKSLVELVTNPYVFLDEEENEISKENEPNTKLKEVLDGHNLNLKKEKINRIILGKKLETKGDLDYYLYPQRLLTSEEKAISTNILIMGETGVGKSTWIHSFINYLQNIQLEEKIRYRLFDEKLLQEMSKKKYGEKKNGESVTDEPAIYNIDSSILYNNPIRLIDTAGFGDTRGPGYDEKITIDIKNLFESSDIENINAICLLFKASETRAHERLQMVVSKLFGLFGKDIKKNIVIIFTFCDNFKDIKVLETLKNKEGPFYEVLGDISLLPQFGFNNGAYDSTDIESAKFFFENNTKNFRELLKYIFSLPSISLESSYQVINDRIQIKNNISNLCDKLIDVISICEAAYKNQNNLIELQQELKKNQACEIPQIPYTVQEPYYETINRTIFCEDGWYVLFCRSCNKVCHRKCKGPNEGWHKTTYGCKMISTLGHKCSECNCNYQYHDFNRSFTVKEINSRMINVVKYKIDHNAKQTEEEKKRIREQITKQIEEGNKELQQRNIQIHNSLDEGIECLFQLALKNKELNTLALKKDKTKYGYAKEILKENFKNRAKNVIFELFNNSLDDIEQLCQSKETKEEAIKNIHKVLLSSK